MIIFLIQPKSYHKERLFVGEKSNFNDIEKWGGRRFFLSFLWR